MTTEWWGGVPPIHGDPYAPPPTTTPVVKPYKPPPKAPPGWIDQNGGYYNPQTGQSGGIDVYGNFVSTPIGGGAAGGGAAGPSWLDVERFNWEKQFSEQTWGNLSAYEAATLGQQESEFGRSITWDQYKWENPSDYQRLTLEFDKLTLDTQNSWALVENAIDQGNLDLAWKTLEKTDASYNRKLDIDLELGQGQIDADRYASELQLQATQITAAASRANAAVQAAAQRYSADVAAGASKYAADKSYAAAMAAIELQRELGRREAKLKEEIFMLEWRRSPADYMAYWGATQPGATQGAPAAAQGQAAPQTAAGAGAMWGMSPPTQYGGQGTPTQAPQWLTTTLQGQVMGEQQMPQWGFERGPSPY